MFFVIFNVSKQAMARAFGAFRTANTGEQEDAQEFLAFFLDQVSCSCVRLFDQAVVVCLGQSVD